MTKIMLLSALFASLTVATVHADLFPSGVIHAAPELRADFFAVARPSVSNLLIDTEQKTGMSIVFMALPTNDSVAARFIYDTERNEPQIQLRRGWEDIEVAHELMHTRMDLIDCFPMLAWRRGVKRTPEIEAAFSRIQTYVKDELVHANLVKAGLRVEDEVIRPTLFERFYTPAARYLEEGRDRANDGMAHLDKLGRGTLCRVCFFVQAELILKNYRAQLTPKRIEQTERFIQAFRKHRPEETDAAEPILQLFRDHDVSTPDGQRTILSAWIKREGLEQFVGLSPYQKTAAGHYTLPFPD